MTNPEIQLPSEVIQKWQEIVDLLAEIMHVPSALVMKVDPPNITVFLSSKSKGNPYEQDEAISLNTALYCETVMKTRQPLLVPDALVDEEWKSNPDTKLGMVSYLGFPIVWPNGHIFGTICVLDNKRNEYSEPYRKLLLQFREVLQADLRWLTELGGELAKHKAHLKRAEAKLCQDEEELRRMTDAIPQAILVLNPDGKAIYANRVALEYTGLSLDEVLAEDFPARVFHPDDVQKLREELPQALSAAAQFENEQRALGKDGKYRWFLIQYNPLLDENGIVIRWYATGTDIDDRKRNEERTGNENLALREQIDRDSMFEDIVGSSEVLRKVLRQVTKVAASDSTVLILGETGTGKELIARAIHKRSRRADRAFIGVNCAAIPTSLVASELFGHEKGAFTGATQRRLGRFELANSGTLFLDEVGDLPPEIQISLLRVLQEREIERVGGNKPIVVDVRVLAATHRDLNALVAEGKFRQDLLYRLNVVPVEIPPLRERVADIPLLVEYFIDLFGRRAGKKFKAIDQKCLDLFQMYGWPGNVRELQNVIERAVILSEGETFSVDETWLKPHMSPAESTMGSLSGALVTQEKQMIEAALVLSQGRVSGPAGAAAKLHLPARTLDSKIKRLGISKDRYKALLG
jgi:formate hydrogenlyase transcriptional activator